MSSQSLLEKLQLKDEKNLLLQGLPLAIEKQLNFEKGVKSANLDTESKIVTVIYNPNKTEPTKLRKSITMVGYDADTLAADPKAYKRLKPCCSKDLQV